MAESIQMLALSCKDVSVLTLSSLNTESIEELCVKLKAYKGLRRGENLSYFILSTVGESAPYQTIRTVYSELMRQFFLIVRENKALRAKVEAGIEEANRAMTVASSVMSPEMLQQALLYPKQSATLDMTFKNIMSVSVPIYEFHTKSEDAASIYPYGFAQTSGELDDALGALASVFQDMLELAQAEKKTQLLASEIEKTRRRVNAL